MKYSFTDIVLGHLDAEHEQSLAAVSARLNFDYNEGKILRVLQRLVSDDKVTRTEHDVLSADGKTRRIGFYRKV